MKFKLEATEALSFQTLTDSSGPIHTEAVRLQAQHYASLMGGVRAAGALPFASASLCVGRKELYEVI